MDPFFLQWIALIGIFLLALASPGPDFVVIVRNSLVYSRLAGTLTAFGFAMGVMIHVSYVLLGLAAIIAESVLLFNIIKVAGAFYLLYMGIQAIRSKGHNPDIKTGNKKNRSLIEFFINGFLTNLLNPKATIFFLAVFSQFISIDTTIIEKLVLAGTCIFMTFLWFSFVALTLSLPAIRQKFLNASLWIDRFCGVALIGLCFKLLVSTAEKA
ncbi:MAG: LysE family transporter [Pseudomonadota bacterium]